MEHLITVEFADVLGAIAQDFHLTRCAQVCFTGTEEDQAERHDHGPIDEVFGDQDMDEGGDVLDDADREGDLRAARSPQHYINAAKTFRCQVCDNTRPKPQTHKVSPPRPCTFDHEVGVDLFEIVDSVGMRFSILTSLCMGTT